MRAMGSGTTTRSLFPLAAAAVALAVGCSAAPPSVSTDASTEPAPGDDASASPTPDAAAPVPCGEFTDATRFTCSKDGSARGSCTTGQGRIEPCANGCLRNKAPADDVCMGTTDAWSCTGVQGTSKALDGNYYTTWFGCWVDANGTHHKDPNDNCIPGCFAYAQQSGLCAKSDTGQQCEEKTVWFTANNGRFGCLSRVRISNPANGKAVVAVVLDGGPACSAEQKIQKAMLDTSAPVFNYLFDDGKTWTTKSYTHVVEVDPSTPLGIVK
jgi:hypothetical protein